MNTSGMTENEILKRVQEVEIGILDEVVRICNKHNLRYYIMYGTLIGAKRHGGFIPWDDDIDVTMPREDYQRFIEICDSELNEQYYFQYYPKEKHYSDNNLHIRKKNTVYLTSRKSAYDYECEGIWLDIWPLDYISKDEFLGGKFRRNLIHALIRLANVRAYVNMSEIPLRNKVFHYLSLPFSLNFLIKIRDKICTKYKQPTGYIINFSSPYAFEREMMPQELYGKPTLIKFGEKEYYGPEKADEVLRHIYGDYMQLPPNEEQRIYHRPVRIEL